MISDHVYNLCRSEVTVSSELAKDPSKPPGAVFHSLFPDKHQIRSVPSEIENDVKPKAAPHQETKAPLVASPEEIKKAFECGKWGKTRPSDLFLKVSAVQATVVNLDLKHVKIYHDVLCTLNDDPKAGMVSPSLMGSSGVLPLTVISGCDSRFRSFLNSS
jgi:hypothetical protein